MMQFQKAQTFHCKERLTVRSATSLTQLGVTRAYLPVNIGSREISCILKDLSNSSAQVIS